ncbi:MAG: oxygen-dependent coproporphyrinogen oxidase [Flavobacteriales bacterium]|nr:oxygen-dependent coproporphyrinogen oxidase [Flavobacteriales bacterium]
MNPTKTEISDWFRQLQLHICAELEAEDGKAKFVEDSWERPGGGGGHSRVIQHGKVFEKGGVNFSAVHGELTENIVKALRVSSNEFFATGVSIVIHPYNPFVPIIHMNVRYFELNDGTYWFGGGIDLTPHYIQAEDAKFFHQQLKNTCDRSDASYYPKFKQWADDYFFIKHRNETRGIGGIFFDRLKESEGRSKEDIWNFVQAVGQTFAPTYRHLVSKNKNSSFDDTNLQWRNLRRGRYVEFNLVYDKGTKFGLETDGRIESILMSLPETASWIYNFQPQKNGLEFQTLNLLRKGVDWVGI